MRYSADTVQQNAAHDVERVMQVCAESGLSVLGLHENWVLLRVAGELVRCY